MVRFVYAKSPAIAHFSPLGLGTWVLELASLCPCLGDAHSWSQADPVTQITYKKKQKTWPSLQEDTEGLQALNTQFHGGNPKLLMGKY